MNATLDKRGDGLDRRSFLTNMSAVGAAALLWFPRTGAAEPPPETKKIRLVHAPALCVAPQYLAEELLRLEGFSEVEYVNIDTSNNGAAMIGAGKADLSMWDVPGAMPHLEAGQAVAVGGVHAGCIEVFGGERVKTIRDIRGKTVAIGGYGGSDHIFMSSMAAYVGIDPRTEIHWLVAGGPAGGIQAFVDGKADAIMAFAPQPQELRARGFGNVILNTAEDRPWSQYFCCAIVANRQFVAKHPVATKRVMRAILKGADICAQDPKRAAAYMVGKGYETRSDIALEVIGGLPYRRWREANPEDTIRFHALRLHEVGMIKSNPQKLITQGTDWRFFDELKKELKA